MEIDWNQVISSNEKKEAVVLREAPIGQVMEVKFDRVFSTEDGSIGADVTTDLPGELLWLASGEHGPQNGLLSLIKTAGSGDDIEGNTFKFTRVESEKSPVGYAYSWTA